MGLPQINIIFKTKGLTAIKRSGRGVVACILRDDTEGGSPLQVYKSILDVDFTHYSQRNYEYLKLIYDGSPSKVIVARIGTQADKLTTELTAALKRLKVLNWNYLTIPGLTPDNMTLVTAWVKEARAQEHKTFKAVLPSCVGDHEGIINFTTDNILSTQSMTAFTTAEYCARIAGVLAGLPLSRSSTAFAFADIVSADVPDDPDERIDKGELVLIFDGDEYQIGRGVNSLTTFTAEKGAEFSKIKIMEGVDLYQDDIRTTYRKSYVGKVINDYDNKQAFVAAIRAYQKALEGDVLDRSYDNDAAVNLEAQRAFLEGKGIDTSDMDDILIAKANTGSQVFLSTKVKFVDAMEDLELICNM